MLRGQGFGGGGGEVEEHRGRRESEREIRIWTRRFRCRLAIELTVLSFRRSGTRTSARIATEVDSTLPPPAYTPSET